MTALTASYWGPWRTVLALTLLCAGASLLPGQKLLASPEAYLGWHNALEMFAMAVAVMIVALGWNVRETDAGRLSSVAGAGYLGVVVLDFVHTMSFSGMPAFVTPSGPEKAINFWLMGRYLLAVTFVALALRVQRGTYSGSVSRAVIAPLYTLTLLLACLGVAVGLWSSHLLPRTFIEGRGLTSLKIGLEYGVVTLHAVSAALLWWGARRDRVNDLGWLAAASWTLALAELFFTLYASVTDAYNLLGHVYKAAASIMVYRALFVSGVRAPARALRAERQRVATALDRERAVINAMAEGLVVLDAQARVVSVNAAAERLLGLDALVVTTPLGTQWEAVREDGSVFPLEQQPVARSLASGQPVHDVVMGVLHGQSRERVWISVNVEPLAMGQADASQGVVMTLADISALRTAAARLRGQEVHLRNVIDALPVGVAVMNTDGVILQVNPKLAQLFDTGMAHLQGQRLPEVLHSSGWQDAERKVRDLAEGRISVLLLDQSLQSLGARSFWVRGVLSPMRDEKGHIVSLLAALRDASQDHSDELALLQHDRTALTLNQLLVAMQQAHTREQLLDVAAQGLASLVPVGGSVVLFQPKTLQEAAESGGEADSFLHRRWGKFPLHFDFWQLAGDDGEGLDHPRSSPLRAVPGLPETQRICLGEGRERLGCVLVQQAHDVDGLLLQLACDALRLTLTNLDLRNSLVHDSTHDALTGLFNRRYLDQTLPREIARSLRRFHSMVVVLADIDHFKRFNDTHGHAVGDRVLARLGKILRRRMRSSDLAARYGGEEFVLVFGEATADVARQRLQDIAAELASEPIGGDTVTLSFGVAELPTHGRDSEGLLKAADDALYSAKALGRNRIEVAAVKKSG